MVFFLRFVFFCVFYKDIACCRRKLNVVSLQVTSTMRLGPASSDNTVRMANTPDAMLLTRGDQQILLVNSTHTVLYGSDGQTSISLVTNETGSFVHVVADALSSNTASLSGTLTTSATTTAADVVDASTTSSNTVTSVGVPPIAPGLSADVFRLADGTFVVAFAPPLYVSTAGVVYLDTSQLGEQVLQQTQNCSELS